MGNSYGPNEFISIDELKQATRFYEAFIEILFMSFLIRPADKKDLVELFDLAKQFTLLNMPADKKFIASRIDESLRSFAGEAPLLERRYFFFVCEDTENGNIAGCSQLIGQKEHRRTQTTVLKY